MPTYLPQTFSEQRVYPSLVTWFNALPESMRTIKPMDTVFFKVAVVEDPNTTENTTTVIIGDAYASADPALMIGEATYTWKGNRHNTQPQTATTTSFLEVSKFVYPQDLSARIAALEASALTLEYEEIQDESN